LKATAKVITGAGQAFWSLSAANDPGWGLTAPLSTIGFQLSRVDGDTLEVSLWQDQGTVNLGPGSADEFHTFELRGAAGTSLFDFYIDGILQSSGNELASADGLAGFDNRLVFNSGIGLGRDTYWNRIALTVVPEPATLVLLSWSTLWLSRQRPRKLA